MYSIVRFRLCYIPIGCDVDTAGAISKGLGAWLLVGIDLVRPSFG